MGTIWPLLLQGHSRYSLVINDLENTDCGIPSAM